MRKILTVISVGIVAMSAFSCTSKLENELAELKEKLNSKFELVIENPNIIPIVGKISAAIKLNKNITDIA